MITMPEPPLPPVATPGPAQPPPPPPVLLLADGAVPPLVVPGVPNPPPTVGPVPGPGAEAGFLNVDGN